MNWYESIKREWASVLGLFEVEWKQLWDLKQFPQNRFVYNYYHLSNSCKNILFVVFFPSIKEFHQQFVKG
jgi:hypothetical protein